MASSSPIGNLDQELLRGRNFQLWELRVSLCTMLIRSPADLTRSSNIDIVCYGVDYLQLPTHLGELRVEAADRQETHWLESILGKDIDPAGLRVLVAQEKRFPVLATFLKVEENERGLYNTRFENSSASSWDSSWPLWIRRANPVWMESYRHRAKSSQRIERSAGDAPKVWDYASPRTFRLWDYSEATRRLVLRSVQSDQQPINIDIAFSEVEYLELPTRLNGLKILETPIAELRRLEDILQKELSPNEVLSLESAGHLFSVVAGSTFLEENQLRYDESPFWKLPQG